MSARLEALGRRAWDAVHASGAFARDFPDDEYFAAVGEQVETSGYDNLTRAEELVAAIERTRGIQRELKAAFARDELDGGPKAALSHPLYLQAQARLEELHGSLKLLI